MQPDISPQHIIIVDDDDTSNFITELIIKSILNDAKISMISNGQEAIDFFMQQQEPPDLALLDINMPLMNGFEFLEYYTKKGYNGRTKFVFFSTSSRQEDKEKSKKYADVIDYIEKPLTTDKLSALLNKLSH